MLKASVARLIEKTGYALVPTFRASYFHADWYLRQNSRVQEHLASLHIPVARMTVLEVGAGIGDHSNYFLDRNCQVTITDAREASLSYIRSRYPGADVRKVDMEHPPEQIEGAPFDIVYCYGLLYHLDNPSQALAFLRKVTGKLLLLETCVSFGDGFEVNLVGESTKNPTQAVSGTGCRPTRPWLWRELSKLYPYVYLPRTQPNHERFPLDWQAPDKHHAELQRAVFVASLAPLTNDALAPELLSRQTRHE
jgi:ubiquinone/menaquinone biosynthesis C-methylase UbiE